MTIAHVTIARVMSLRVQTWYTEKISELTLYRLASFLLKMISRVPVPGHALLENGIRYHDSDVTVA